MSGCDRAHAIFFAERDLAFSSGAAPLRFDRVFRQPYDIASFAQNDDDVFVSNDRRGIHAQTFRRNLRETRRSESTSNFVEFFANDRIDFCGIAENDAHLLDSRGDFFVFFDQFFDFERSQAMQFDVEYRRCLLFVDGKKRHESIFGFLDHFAFADRFDGFVERIDCTNDGKKHMCAFFECSQFSFETFAHDFAPKGNPAQQYGANTEFLGNAVVEYGNVVRNDAIEADLHKKHLCDLMWVVS